ncbi:MAG: hypothetical protein HS119_08910 [Flavobacteriales bacterium]|jgi:hypothetical protein|nr:hypothetical protein [Flavobacteriales bacterium]
MSRYILLFGLMIILRESSFSQEKIFYSNEKHDYSFLISKNATVERTQIEGGYIENFIISSFSSEFKYTVTVTKTSNNDILFENLKEDDYKQSYLENCSCEIQENREILYNNLKSFQFKIKRVDEGITLMGYSDNIIHNNTLYIVIYMSTAEKFEEYKDEYKVLMNSLIINK